MEKSELRAVIKYLCLKGLSPSEIYDDMVGTLAGGAPSSSMVKNWCAEFKRGRQSCEDAPRSGRPTTSTTAENVDSVHDQILADRRSTVRHIAESLNLSYGTVERIISDHLQYHKVSARWVPRMLTGDQKRQRVNDCRVILQMFVADSANFLSRYVTVDEVWVHHFEPLRKEQSKEWRRPGDPPPIKFRVQASAGKVMATVFWDAEGVVKIDYLEHGRTITGAYYADQIRDLKECLKQKRRGKLRHGILLHQDNAPSHTSAVAMAAIHACGFQLLPHPPYSPDLAPSDYYLFPKLKDALRGNRYSSESEVIDAVNDWLGDQSQEFFQAGIKALQHRLDKCIRLQGTYVEKT